MSNVTHAKLVIIGSGPAGCTAAIYAARAMLEPIMIRGYQAGGQLTITTDVENYPGFAETIQGPWLMEQMEKQAEHVGTRLVADQVTKLNLSQRPFRLECDSGDVYLADAVVLATGAQARWLDLPSEQKFKGYGVSACATASSTAARTFSSSAAATPRSRRRCSLPTSPRTSPWCTGAIISARRKSCRTGCSRIRRSR
jgi:thioredoxin reductase (NADPH)